VTDKEQTGFDTKALAKRFRDALNEAIQEDPVQHIREAFQERLGEPADRRQDMQSPGGTVGNDLQQHGAQREPWWKRVFRW